MTANARSILSMTFGAFLASFNSLSRAALAAFASAAAAAASSGSAPIVASPPSSFAAVSPATPPVVTASGLKSFFDSAPPTTMRVLSAPFSTRATPVGSSASANDLLWVTATTAPSQPRNAFVSASTAAASR